MTAYRCIFLLCALAACVPSVTTNFQYAKAGGLGTQNAGLFEPGTLFLWNTTDQSLQRLATLQLNLSSQSASPANMKSTSVAGIEISAIPASLNGKEGAIAASVGRSSTFEANGAVRFDYDNGIGAIASYVSGLVTSGEDADEVVRPRDPDYRLVLITSIIRAKSSKLSVGGIDASDPNTVVNVNVGAAGQNLGTVKIKASTSTSCDASDQAAQSGPACFFNVTVIDPYYTEGTPVMKFKRTSFSTDALSAAFRKL